MKKLRIQKYLLNIQEYDGVAIEGTLQCSCFCNLFKIFHSGKQTKGILSPFLVRKHKQLCIKAICSDCGNDIIIYDSKIDGSNMRMIKNDLIEFKQFILPKFDDEVYNINLKYNFLPKELKVEGTYSNNFEHCFIDISNNNIKTKRLIEE